MRIVALNKALALQTAQIEAMCFSEPWSEQAYLEACEKEDYLYLAAVEEDGRVVGMCGLIIGMFDAEVMNVAVHPQHRGNGIAKALLAALLKAGEERGVTEFTLEVRVSNAAAIHLYESFGFIREGVRPNFYRKPVEDALIMWKRERSTGEIV